MANISQSFQFTTKNIPQAPGTDGARWENIPIASMPPSLDITIPDSFGSGVAAAVSGFTEQFKGFKNSLESITQNVQNSACQLQGIIDNLQFAQDFMKQTTEANNNTNVYVRLIGVDPVGTINTAIEFNRQIRDILFDTRSAAGGIPKIVPAEIPISPTTIANALGSGESTLERALTLSGGVGEAFAGIGGLNVGLNLRTLSNDDEWRNGFNGGSVLFETVSITKSSETAEVILKTSTVPQVENTITITNAAIDANNGTFTIDNISVTTQNQVKVRYLNSNAQSDTSGQARVSFSTSETRVDASTLVKQTLEEAGFYGDASGAIQLGRDASGTVEQKHTIPATTLVELLVAKGLIGTNPELAAEDRDIALERLTQLIVGQSTRIGGMVFVGRAPNLGALARKIQTLSTVMEWMKPLAEKLAFAALSETSINESGIEFSAEDIDLAKLTPEQNVAKQDVKSLLSKIDASGILDFEQPKAEVVQDTENPSPTDFKSWRKYKPIQLIPGMSNLTGAAEGSDSLIQSNTGQVIGRSAKVLGDTIGTLPNLIQAGIDEVGNGIASLESQTGAIDSITTRMNELGGLIQDGMNFLKNQVGGGTVQLDGHLIGPKLNLQSNEAFVRAVETAVNDIADPNRPTFGAASGTRVSDRPSTALWFGMVLVIIGKDRRSLGDQMSTVAELLSMDTEPIAHKKKKIKWKL